MRPVPLALILLAAIACGGRARDGSGERDGDFASGGALNGGAWHGGTPTDGGSLPSFGGAISSGGAVGFGGALPSGGRPPTSGGRASRGGAPSAGGVATDPGAAGAGGDTSCFTAVQSSDDYCFEVELCATVQRESLCAWTDTGDVLCTCFVDGRAQRSQTYAAHRQTVLCTLATTFDCRGD